MRHDMLAGPRDGRREEWSQALEILRIFSDWSWNRFMRTEPKSRGSSMSRHPWSQFLLGSSIAGFCQVQRKFIISSFETGFPLIPNWLIRFSSLRPSYCPQAKGKTFLFENLPEDKALCGLLRQTMSYENKRSGRSHVINALSHSAAWGSPAADAHLTFSWVTYIPWSSIDPDFSPGQLRSNGNFVFCISVGLPKVNCVLCSICFWGQPDRLPRWPGTRSPPNDAGGTGLPRGCPAMREHRESVSVTGRQGYCSRQAPDAGNPG